MVDNKLQEYNDQVTGLWDKLMGLELQLVDQLEVSENSTNTVFLFCHQMVSFLNFPMVICACVYSTLQCKYCNGCFHCLV